MPRSLEASKNVARGALPHAPFEAREIIAGAFESIFDEDRDEFFKWIVALPQAKKSIYCASIPNNPGDLGLEGTSLEIDYVSQLDWCSRVIALHEASLIDYLLKRSTLEIHWLNGELDLAPELQARVRILARQEDFGFQAAKAFTGVKPNRSPQILLGPIATGSAVIANKKIFPEIARQNRDLIGAEMEAYGVYAASLDAKSPKPMCMAMKGVCDFGDEEKDNKYQKFAAYMSAYTVKAFLEKFGKDIRATAY